MLVVTRSKKFHLAPEPTIVFGKRAQNKWIWDGGDATRQYIFFFQTRQPLCVTT